MWKYLKHQNIVPLLGVTSTPFQIISDWMPGGNLTEYIKKHPDADRLDIVDAPPIASDPTLTPATSFLASLKAFVSFTPTT